MIKIIDLLNDKFESSSCRTPEYLNAHKQFKKEFIKLLKPYTKNILIHKPNHFDISGFFELNNNEIYYFSIGDLRWNKIFLLRTATDFKDYTGGRNNFITLNYDFVNILFNKLGLNNGN